MPVHVGLPFFLLAATGPLIQVWWNRAVTTGTLYRLYALSNFRSLLALVSYLFLVEPALSLSTQVTVWSVAFAIQSLLLITRSSIFGWRKTRVGESACFADVDVRTFNTRVESALSNTHCLMWIALATTESVMLLATISHEVAVLPLLWVVPLSIYLLTFIIYFSGWWIPHWPFVILVLISTTYVAFEQSGGDAWLEDTIGLSLPYETGLADNYIFTLRATPEQVHIVGHDYSNRKHVCSESGLQKHPDFTRFVEF